MTILLAAMFLYICALEVTTRLVFPRINHIWRILQADHLTAISLHPSEQNAATLLMVCVPLLVVVVVAVIAYVFSVNGAPVLKFMMPPTCHLLTIC